MTKTIDAQSEYKKLLAQSRLVHRISGIHSLLDWDQETMMPEEGVEERAEQLKILSGLAHKESLSKKFSTPLFKLIDEKSGAILDAALDEGQKRALKEWRRSYKIQKSLPQKFVESFAALTSKAMDVWKKARKESNFKLFQPYLQKIIDASKRKADYIGYKSHPYDALIDLYEPEISTQETAKIFQELKEAVVPLLKRIASTKQVDASRIYGSFPQDKQIKLSKALLEAMGVNWKRERLDLSTHPFCSMSQPHDCRLTTRIQEDYAFGCLLTVLHEGGHALYDLGLPVEHYGSPLGDSISMGIHESQSRFWETRIGLSRPFTNFILPQMKAMFPGELPDVSEDYFYKAINLVEPSFIRVEADEVTYPLHVILRFELEVKLIEGSLSTKDLPDAWNEGMKKYLGITPPNDTKGCLQDVHWSMGGFGYFPTYALGNLYAAQIFSNFEKTHKDWKEKVAKGELLFIRSYLNDAVYRHGKRFSGGELIQKISGNPLGAKDFTNYLTSKYSAIYGLK